MKIKSHQGEVPNMYILLTSRTQLSAQLDFIFCIPREESDRPYFSPDTFWDFMEKTFWSGTAGDVRTATCSVLVHPS
jgi:hypothetical protein